MRGSGCNLLTWEHYPTKSIDTCFNPLKCGAVDAMVSGNAWQLQDFPDVSIPSNAGQWMQWGPDGHPCPRKRSLGFNPLKCGAVDAIFTDQQSNLQTSAHRFQSPQMRGSGCNTVPAQVNDLAPTEIVEVDELFSFVAKKRTSLHSSSGESSYTADRWL